MVEIYIVRHGKTKMNEKSIVIGHLNPPLLPSNIDDIKKIAKRLKKIKFKTIYSSNLKRAQKTAQIIAKELENPVKIKTSAKLKEINYGALSGRLKREIRKKYPSYHKDIKFINPKGESFNQVYLRVVSFLEKIINKKDKFLIVTHAGCIRAIYSYLRDEDFQKNLNMKISHDFIMKYSYDGKKKRAIILQN